MKKQLIRVWTEQDIEDIDKHLLIVGDVCGDCSICKELGLDFSAVNICPHCKTEFKYISSRNAATGTDRRFQEVRRIIARRNDLVFVDYEDYKKASGSNKAKKFFQD